MTQKSSPSLWRWLGDCISFEANIWSTSSSAKIASGTSLPVSLSMSEELNGWAGVWVNSTLSKLDSFLKSKCEWFSMAFGKRAVACRFPSRTGTALSVKVAWTNGLTFYLADIPSACSRISPEDPLWLWAFCWSVVSVELFLPLSRVDSLISLIKSSAEAANWLSLASVWLLLNFSVERCRAIISWLSLDKSV